MAKHYLSLTQLAHRIGITRGGTTLLKLPEPDAYVGNTRGWLPETVDRWNAQRPGHGGRPLLTSINDETEDDDEEA